MDGLGVLLAIDQSAHGLYASRYRSGLHSLTNDLSPYNSESF